MLWNPKTGIRQICKFQDKVGLTSQKILNLSPVCRWVVRSGLSKAKIRYRLGVGGKEAVSNRKFGLLSKQQ